MRSWSKLLVLPILALVLSSCANAFTTAAAVVDGQRITVDEVEAQVEASLRSGQAGPGAQEPRQRLEVARRVLTSFIQQRALRRGAEREGIRVTPSQVEDEYRSIRERFTTEEEFQAQLREAGFTVQTLRDRIRDQILIDRLRTKLGGAVTEAAVRARYMQQQSSYRQVQVRHLLFQCCQQAGAPNAQRSADQAKRLTENALREIRGGRSFEEVARQRSEDTGSKAQGGLLPGWTSIAQLDQSFGAAAWSARIGEVVGPVRSQFGYHLIVTLAKRVQPLSEVSAQIRESIETETGDEALRGFIGDQLERSDIAVNPRYGRWDEQAQAIVERDFYEPADPDIDPAGEFPGLAPFAP